MSENEQCRACGLADLADIHRGIPHGHKFEPVASPQATTEEREFCFDRYVNGRLMAQGAKVHTRTLEQALAKAKVLFHNDSRDRFVLRSVDGESPAAGESE